MGKAVSKKPRRVWRSVATRVMSGIIQIFVTIVASYCIVYFINDKIADYNLKTDKLNKQEESLRTLTGCISEQITLSANTFYCRNVNQCDKQAYQAYFCDLVLEEAIKRQMNASADCKAVGSIAQVSFSQEISEKIAGLLDKIDEIDSKRFNLYDCNAGYKDFKLFIDELNNDYYGLLKGITYEIEKTEKRR